MGDEHISFTTSKIGSLIDVNNCKYVDYIVFLYSNLQNISEKE